MSSQGGDAEKQEYQLYTKNHGVPFREKSEDAIAHDTSRYRGGGKA